MDCVAHRGFAADHPENTAEAVSAAAGRADMVEVDLRRCASGELVAAHDETVGRVTDGSGAVANLTADELAALSVEGSGEGVPTLGAVLDAAPGAGLVLDLKEHGLASDAMDAVADHRGEVLLSSADSGVLATASLAGDVPLALVVADEPLERLERAADLGCAAIHAHWDLCDADFVERAHDEGLAVRAWTIDDRVAASAARSAGVDGLIADASALC